MEKSEGVAGRWGRPERDEPYRHGTGVLIPEAAYLAILSGDARVRSLTTGQVTGCVRRAERGRARGRSPGPSQNARRSVRQTLTVPFTTSIFELSPAERTSSLKVRLAPDERLERAVTVTLTIFDPPDPTVVQ
jgi:hypothetical protein